jgi:hypothetical protein
MIDLSIRPPRKLSRGRLALRILIVVAGFAAVFAMARLPNPAPGALERDAHRGKSVHTSMVPRHRPPLLPLA